MAEELLSVLDHDPDDDVPGLDLEEDDLRRLYEYLLLVRAIDDRADELLRAGHIRFFVPAGTHAAASLGAADALEDRDWLYPSYRDFPAWLLRGGSLRELVAQLLGSGTDPLHGRQLPGHLCLPEGRFVAVSGPLTSHLAQAVGTAMALGRDGDPGVVLASHGRLAGRRGSFVAALREAAERGAPVIFGWRGRGEDPSALADAHGVPVCRVDGGDVLAVRTMVRRAREAALAGEGPQLVVARLDGAAEGPDAATRLRRFLEARGSWEADWHEEVERRCREGLAEAVGRAAGSPDPETVLADVTAEPAWMLLEQGEQLAARRGED